MSKSNKIFSTLIVALALIMSLSSQNSATQLTTSQKFDQVGSDYYDKRVMKSLLNHLSKFYLPGNERIDFELPGADNDGTYQERDSDYYNDLYPPVNDPIQPYRERYYPIKRGSLCAFNAVACKIRKPNSNNLKTRALLKSI